MSIGLDDNNSKKKINLTQLRRNTRCRAEKKCGRKAPRPGDYEINPAPDASAVIKVRKVLLLLSYYNCYTK